MGAFSFTHIVVVLGVLALLFGAQRVTKGMKDLGTALRGFRAGVSGEIEHVEKEEKEDRNALH